MITRALIVPGPTDQVRRAAYKQVLGPDCVDWLTDTASLTTDVVVDLDDPDDLPDDLSERLLASDALIVAGAPVAGAPDARSLAAWPDLLAGPVVAIAADLDSLGRRTMSKSVVVAEAPGIAPAAWRAVLGLVALGGGLRRIAARLEPRGPGFSAIYGVGRFHDDSIAYVEAMAGAPPGAALSIYEALGRGGIREYDSRRSINRVIKGGVETGLPATQDERYAQFVGSLCRGDDTGPPPALAPVLAEAHAAYAALMRACESGTAVTL
ncbi:MAG: hypothetical protein OXG64_05770 [Chloroflexi bacterium]|nr:hypothetical protein [Chloroflexota bacterium]